MAGDSTAHALLYLLYLLLTTDIGRGIPLPGPTEEETGAVSVMNQSGNGDLSNSDIRWTMVSGLQAATLYTVSSVIV